MNDTAFVAVYFNHEFDDGKTRAVKAAGEVTRSPDYYAADADGNRGSWRYDYDVRSIEMSCDGYELTEDELLKLSDQAYEALLDAAEFDEPSDDEDLLRGDR